MLGTNIIYDDILEWHFIVFEDLGFKFEKEYKIPKNLF